MLKKYNQLIIGLANQCFNILSPFLVIVISLKYVDTDQGSLWLIFLSMMVLINIFDFGLSPTIIRNVSYVVSGAQKLVRHGMPKIEYDDDVPYPLLVRLLQDIKKIYSIITVVAFFFIVILGGVYFFYISPLGIRDNILISWVIYSSALLMNLYFIYYTPILCGFGVIQYAYYANIIGKLVWLLFTILAIFYYPTIIGLALAFLISVLVNRVIIAYYFNRNSYTLKMDGINAQKESTIPFLAHNAIKLGMVILGSFMISRATVLICGIFLPLNLAGEYAFTLQVYIALLAIGNVYMTIKVPEFSRLVIQGDSCLLRTLIIKVISLSLAIYILGFIFFYSLSTFITSVLHTKVAFLDGKFLLLLGVVFLLELFHSICGTILTTKNKIPFVKPALISGVCIVILSFILLKYTNMGIMGLILAQGFIQLLYNNWKWPVSIYKEFFCNDRHQT